MIKCPKCGKEIPKEANFCPYCMEKFAGDNLSKKFSENRKMKIIPPVIISCLATAIICILVMNGIKSDNGNNSDTTSATTETVTTETPSETVTEDYLNPDRNGPWFTEESILGWPVTGNILMKFSVNETVYYKTQDHYAISEGILVQSGVGTPVYCAADCTIMEIAEHNKYGTYVKTDLGNGYILYYGQLKEVELKSGETLKKGEIVGYINRPSEYFKLEESHLYLQMIKKGKAVDPLNYMER